MQLEHAWERSLLDRAYEALRGQSEHPTTLEGFDHGVLETAYDYCDNITAVNSRSFHLASGLLPVPKRRAVRALYAFCRVSDDIVDRSGAERGQRLETWRRHATAAHPPADDFVAVAWADARQRYHVPARYAEQLIDGVARDLNQTALRFVCRADSLLLWGSIDCWADEYAHYRLRR